MLRPHPSPFTITTDVAAELGAVDRAALKQLCRAAKKLRNKVVWRRRSQLRCSLISSGIAAGRRALGDLYCGRKRHGRDWAIFGRDDDGEVVAAIRIKVPSLARHDDFTDTPVTVDVLRPDLVDVAELRRWSARLRGQADE